MQRIMINGVISVLVTFVTILPCQAFGQSDAPTFEKHIAPFLKTYCLGCHDGGDDSKGGLSVLTYKALMAGGDGGEVIEPGKSGESRAVLMMLGKEPPKMPPKGAKQPKAEEIELVRRWVDAGAKGPAVAAVQSADELELPKIEPQKSVSAAVTAVAFSADGKWLAAARHREVLLFDASDGKLVHTLAGAENPINAVAFSPDSRLVAAGEGFAGVVGKARVWEVGKPEPRTFTGHADSIYTVAFSPNGQLLLTASYDKLLALWDVAGGTQKAELKHHTGSVFGAAFSPDGKWIASVAADQTVKLWNVETAQRVATLTEATKGLNAVAFSPTGREFASGGIDKMLRIYEWDGTAAKLKRSAFAHEAAILAMVYSPDGRTLFTSSEDGRVKAWDAVSLRERHVYEGLPDWALALAVSKDGSQLAAGFYNGDLSVFETGAAKKVREVLGRSAAKAVSRLTPPAPPLLRGGDAVIAAAVIGQAETKPAEEKPAAPKPNPPRPRLDSVGPRAVVRGNKVKLTLSGQNIWDADRVFVSAGNLKLELLPGDEKKPNVREAEVEIPADMQPGNVSVRLHTPLGSTAGKSFYVGPFPEVGEKEDNATREKATPATLPATLVGTINAKGDKDVWSFEAKTNQELVFILQGPKLGSALNAKMTLFDENGTWLRDVSRVPYLEETVLFFDQTSKIPFPTKETARYYLQIEDRNYTGGGGHFYYVHAGVFPYVTDVDPLAVRSAGSGDPLPGEVQRIDVRGVNLATLPMSIKSEVPVRAIDRPSVTGTQFVKIDTMLGATLNSARFESSPFAEFSEQEPNNSVMLAQSVPAPCGVSGALTYPRVGQGAHSGTVHETDVDHFSFDAKKGDRLTVEVLARRLGSPLDSVLEILHADGKPVAKHTLRAVAETYTVLRDHDSRSLGIRLQAWDDFMPGDLVMLGGEITKVRLLPLGPDEDVKFFDKGGVRLAYQGTTSEAHALNSAAYKVEVHPPGMTFPPNGMPVTTLSYRNDDGGPGYGSDSVVFFDPPADGKYVARVRDVRGETGYGRSYFYRLVIRPRNEDFRISLDLNDPDIPRGGSLPVTVNLDRLDGFNGPVDIRVEGLPEGITATATRIGPDQFTAVLTLTAVENAPQPSGDEGLKTRVIASGRIGDRMVEHTTGPAFGVHQVTITSPPDLKVQVEPMVAAISPGQTLRFHVTIERRNAFSGRVPVEVLNLPHGLRVLDVGLNGVLINENEVTRSFVVACDPWAPPGPLTFFAAPKVEAKNERHASQGIQLEVKGIGAETAGK